MAVQERVQIAQELIVDAPWAADIVHSLAQETQITQKLEALVQGDFVELSDLRNRNEDAVAREELGIAHHGPATRQPHDRGWVLALLR